MTDRPTSGAIFTAMVYGAVLGGVAMGWLLLASGQRDRLANRQRRMLHMPRMIGDENYGHDDDDAENAVAHGKSLPNPLEERMSQIQTAIEDVRRQLEAMGNDG